LTVATFESDDPHCAELVRSFELPSEYLPVAVNCSVPLAATEALPGATWSIVSDGAGGGGGGGTLDPPPEVLADEPPPQALRNETAQMIRTTNAVFTAILPTQDLNYGAELFMGSVSWG